MLEPVDQFSDGAFYPANSSDRRSGWPHRFIKKIRALGLLFICTVLIPTTVSVVYFTFLASDIYVSESRFVVRSPDKPVAGGLDLLLKGVGFSNDGDEAYVAKDYITSRDALRALNRENAFARAYNGSVISYFDRYGSLVSGESFEDLYRYFKSRVKVEHDSSSAITTLTVRAYRPEDAQRFNELLLQRAETIVNHLSERGRQDLIALARDEVESAKSHSRAAALALAAYRNHEGVVDPEKQAAVQLQMISKIQDELIASRTQLAQLARFAPQNPQIPVLRTRIAELTQEISAEQGKVAGNSGSLAASAVQFQRLSLENQLADKQLASAMASLAEAQSDARRQQAYVERIVQPNRPDASLEPQRLRGILATLALGLVAWGILTMLLAGVKEHRD